MKQSKKNDKKNDKAKPKAKASTARKASTKKKEDEKDKDKDTSAKDDKADKSADAAASKPEKTSPSLVEKGQACLDSLKDATPFGIWHGIKGKELDGRVARAFDTMSKLENRPGDSDPAVVSKLIADLGKQADRVVRDTEVFQGLATPFLCVKTEASPPPHPCIVALQNHAEYITEVALTWTPENLSSFLTDIGRKLCDQIHLQMAESEDTPTFYHFVTINQDPKWTGFSLGFLAGKLPSEDQKAKDETMLQLAQAQQHLINYYLDRFRTLPAHLVAGVIKTIPLTWCLPEICRTLGGLTDKCKRKETVTK